MIRRITNFFENKRNLKKYFLLIALMAIVVLVPEGQAQAGDLAELTKGGIQVILTPVYLILFVILNIFLKLSTLWVMLGSSLVDLAMSPGLYVGDSTIPIKGVLNSDAIDIGWTTVRDICNMFFIFFFLLAAFGTILRSSSFNIKTILPKIVISMFLINFSKEATLLVIDLSQLFMYEIGSWMGDFGSASGSLTNIVSSFNKDIGFNNGFIKIWGFKDIVQVAFALAFSLFLGLIYIMLAVFLFIRLVAFAILIVLSPFAFLAFAIPSMSKHATKWWSELTKWAIFGPAFMFFIFLSSTMANQLLQDPTMYGWTAPTELNFIGVAFYRVVMASVPLLMLLFAPQIANELGVAGASQIVGGRVGLGKMFQSVRGLGKKSWGVGKQAGSQVVNRNKRIRSIADKGNKKVDKFFARYAPGTQMKREHNRDKQRKLAIEDLEVKYGPAENMRPEVLDKKINQFGSHSVWGAMKLKRAAKRGELNDNPAEMAKLMASSQHQFSKESLKEITDRSLTLSIETREAKEDISKRGTKGMSPDEVIKYNRLSNNEVDEKKKEKMRIEQYQREIVPELEKNNKINGLQDLSNEDSAKIIFQSLSSEGKKRAIASMPKDQQKEFAVGLGKNILNDSSTENKEENMEMMVATAKLGGDLYSIIKDKAKIIDPKEQAKTAKEIVSRLNTNQIAGIKGNKSISLLSESLEKSQLKNLIKSGEQSIVNEIMDDLKDKIIDPSKVNTAELSDKEDFVKKKDKEFKEVL